MTAPPLQLPRGNHYNPLRHLTPASLPLERPSDQQPHRRRRPRRRRRALASEACAKGDAKEGDARASVGREEEGEEATDRFPLPLPSSTFCCCGGQQSCSAIFGGEMVLLLLGSSNDSHIMQYGELISNRWGLYVNIYTHTHSLSKERESDEAFPPEYIYNRGLQTWPL